MTGADKILICIPTCMRPKMLTACLASVARTKLPDGFETRLLVLDNDKNESARDVFAAQKFPFAARYAVEQKRGLSTIRNRALDEAQNENASHLAFVDDDQTVDENWLCALADGMQKTGADAIGGYVEQVFSGKVPWWVRPSKMSPQQEAKITRAFFPTNLLLMKSRLFSRLRFDEEFNLTGAEDYDFAMRAMRLGFVSASTGLARAFAPVTAVRMTFRSHVMSQWQRQTGYVLSHKKADGFAKSLLFLPKGIIRTAKGVLYLALAPLFGKKLLCKSAKNLIAGTGLICGVFAHGGYQKYADPEGE